jgi:hypothetical protein
MAASLGVVVSPIILFIVHIVRHASCIIMHVVLITIELDAPNSICTLEDITEEDLELVLSSHHHYNTTTSSSQATTTTLQEHWPRSENDGNENNEEY